jgi:hypothetical protein
MISARCFVGRGAVRLYRGGVPHTLTALPITSGGRFFRILWASLPFFPDKEPHYRCKG